MGLSYNQAQGPILSGTDSSGLDYQSSGSARAHKNWARSASNQYYINDLMMALFKFQFIIWSKNWDE